MPLIPKRKGSHMNTHAAADPVCPTCGKTMSFRDYADGMDLLGDCFFPDAGEIRVRSCWDCDDCGYYYVIEDVYEVSLKGREIEEEGDE